jgi:outer membrane protein assembly factor BamB/tetratricopeptide (TPR) repeat protein
VRVPYGSIRGVPPIGAGADPKPIGAPRLLVWILALSMGLLGVQRLPGAIAREGAGAPVTALVSADDELAEYLRQARTFVEAKQFDQAINILQALIARPDSGFIAVEGSTHRYTSLWRSAQELIQSMPEAGRKLYRTLYDPQARQLLEQARGVSNQGLLRRIATEYRYTSFGPAALEALGTAHFDAGGFSLAGEAWKEALRAQTPSPREALLLARIATARRLAGDTSEWRNVLVRLQRDHPQATAVFAGREQSVVSFVRSLESLTPPAPPKQPQDAWAGLSMSADGMTTMDPSDAVLVPRWRRPDDREVSGGDLPEGLIAQKESLRISGNPHMGLTVRLRSGHVRAELKYGSRLSEFVCPATVHPVVIGESVLFRTDQTVEAFDAFTGARNWTPRDPFPLYRKLPELNSTRYYRTYSFSGSQLGDKGRHALSVADGRVFALGNFLPPLHPTVRANLRRQSVDESLRQKLADTSTLGAWSLEDSPDAPAGTLLWRVGYGDDADDPLSDFKFLSAPTPYTGRLFVVGIRLQNLQLLCLDPRTGELLWKTSVSQLPALDRRFAVLADHAFERGSSPAASNGRVYVATNTGVIAAFDADTGRPAWAYQYDRRNQLRRPMNPNSPAQELFYPPNPLLISRGRLVSLPADGDHLLALSTEDGALLWRADRRGLRDLSAIDADRLLLSGPGLGVVSLDEGKLLFEQRDGLEIQGRPAVTPSEVLTSDDGRLVRLNLAGYRTSSVGLGDARGLLGNLVSLGGKLVAANAAGVCTYFNYEQARRRVSRMIEASDPARRSQLLFQRGQLAFNAGRFGQARDDLSECLQLARIGGDPHAAPAARIWLYRTHIALGNRETSPEAMRAEFGRAMDLAETNQERAHMLLRFARYRESIGQHARAAALAQDVSERYGDEPLVDVRIGTEAGDETRFGEDRATVPGHRLAQDYIRRLIELYGRQPYAEMDRKAQLAFEKAKTSGDPDRITEVARRWPNSVATDSALLTAAEIFYERALPAHYEARRLGEGQVRDRARAFAGQADQLFGRSVELLSEVANRRNSALRLRASVGIAIVYARRGYDTTAILRCREVRRLCRQNPTYRLDHPVAFGEVRASVEEVLRSIETGRLERPTEGAEFGRVLRPPLGKAFSIQDASAQFLRDQEYRPVRLGENLLLVRQKTVSLVDVSSRDLKDGVQWSLDLPIDMALAEKFASYPPGQRLMGGLSRDQKLLIVSDRQSVTAIRAVSGEVVWQKSGSRLFDRPIEVMAIGEDLWVAGDTEGNLVCLDVQTGEERWRTRTVGKPGRIIGSPTIAHGLVMVSNTNSRHLMLYSASTGKILAHFSANTYTQGILSDEGFLVLMMDGELSVREATRPGGAALWSRKYPTREAKQGKPRAVFPAVLGVAGDRIVVSPNHLTGEMDVLSMTEAGRRLAILSTGSSPQEPAFPVDAWMEGESVYVACTTAGVGRRKGGFGRYSTARGLSLQRFDLAGGTSEPRWRQVLESDPRSYGQLLPVTIAGQHLVVLVKHYQIQLPFYACIIDAANGKTLRKIDLTGLGADPKARLLRQRIIAPPIVTNGRLCVETCDGIEVYEGQ